MVPTQYTTKGSFTGFYDINNNPIHEGVVIHFRNFRAVVIFNEFHNVWTNVFVGAYNDMQRNPYCRSMYLADYDAGLSDSTISYWGIRVSGNIYKNPAQLSDNSLLAYQN